MDASSFLNLAGQTAMVTGAATGIGAAIARRLAEAGAAVAIADLDGAQGEQKAAAIAQATGAKVWAVAMDVTRRETVERAVEAVAGAAGVIDILVNNAGIAGRAAPLWEQTDEDWATILAINLTGVFLCSRAAIGHMRRQGYGRIVNIASIAGKEGNPRMTGYSATKAGVIGFTKSLAKDSGDGGDLRERGVAGGSEDGDPGATDRRTGGVHDRADSDAAAGTAGGDCGGGAFSGKPRVFVCYRAVL